MNSIKHNTDSYFENIFGNNNDFDDVKQLNTISADFTLLTPGRSGNREKEI